MLGKADTLEETPFQTARREAFEEIGLPLSDDKIPPPYQVEHLCQLPTHLAKTELGVRPCVAFLSTDKLSNNSANPSISKNFNLDVETNLIPRLNAGEVAAVFTAPFHSFLRATDGYTTSSANSTFGTQESTGPGVEATGFAVEWYRGSWTEWHESRWRMHNFYVPVNRKTVTLPKSSSNPKGLNQGEKDELPSHFRVWGMTARILVDCARIAYAEEPEFEHNAHLGDEEMIARLLKIGRLSPIRKSREELSMNILKEAANSKI
jgi:hypothetical protein